MLTSISICYKHYASTLCLDWPYLLLHCIFLIFKTSYQILTNLECSLFWNNTAFGILASWDITLSLGLFQVSKCQNDSYSWKSLYSWSRMNFNCFSHCAVLSKKKCWCVNLWCVCFHWCWTCMCILMKWCLLSPTTIHCKFVLLLLLMVTDIYCLKPIWRLL